jgi:membrane protein YdbS with pleckstrin-like domain
VRLISSKHARRGLTGGAFANPFHPSDSAQHPEDREHYTQDYGRHEEPGPSMAPGWLGRLRIGHDPSFRDNLVLPIIFPQRKHPLGPFLFDSARLPSVSRLEHRGKTWNRKRMDTPGPVDQERVIWSAHPSQVINFGTYAACILVWLLVIPLFLFFRQNAPRYVLVCFGVIMVLALLVFLNKWIRTRSRLYQVTSERVKMTDGVFNRKTEEIELYRVRDYKLEEPFWLRIFGLGNITISTMDLSTPTLVIKAVRDANGRREQLRKFVELCRDKKNVRLTELET